MDLYRPINKFLIFPLYYWRRGDKRLKRLAQIEPIQYWTLEEIEHLQFIRVKKMIRHAYKHTRYYRRLMDEHQFKPEDFHLLADIQYLPLLTKSLIQQNLQDMVADNIPKNKLVKDASGGSTGEPTIYYKDKDRNNLRRADQIRHDRWCGWDLGDESALIWGAPRDLNPSVRDQIVIRMVERRIELNAFDLSPTEMARYRKILEVHQPTMILGYAGALFHFADYLNSQFPDHQIRPKGLISTAESLSEEKRAFIEKVFKARVLNRYGSREVGLIASECQAQKGLHINADNVFVEVLHQDSPTDAGERGDIVVTDLWNYGMPFLRYKMEDVGSMSPDQCTCGRGLPLLERVDGRSSDFFLAQDGSRIHGEYFTHLFYDLPEVKRFQIIQQEKELIELKIVEGTSSAKRAYVSELEQHIKKTLGSQVELKISFVDDIPPSPSGKYRFTISRV